MAKPAKPSSVLALDSPVGLQMDAHELVRKRTSAREVLAHPEGLEPPTVGFEVGPHKFYPLYVVLYTLWSAKNGG